MLATILGGILSLVGVPSSVASIIVTALPIIQASLPVVEELIKEGVPAFEAAKAKAPGLVAAIGQLATHIPNLTATGDTSAHVENVARTIFGFNKMTPEQEAMYVQNLKDSGYNPADDFDEYGNMKVGG